MVFKNKKKIDIGILVFGKVDNYSVLTIVIRYVNYKNITVGCTLKVTFLYD